MLVAVHGAGEGGVHVGGGADEEEEDEEEGVEVEEGGLGVGVLVGVGFGGVGNGWGKELPYWLCCTMNRLERSSEMCSNCQVRSDIYLVTLLLCVLSQDRNVIIEEAQSAGYLLFILMSHAHQ